MSYPKPDVRELNKTYMRQDILDNTNCDICNRHAKDGVKMRWFGSSTVICDDPNCSDEMDSRWQEHCKRCDEEDAIRREHERYLNAMRGWD